MPVVGILILGRLPVILVSSIHYSISILSLSILLHGSWPKSLRKLGSSISRAHIIPRYKTLLLYSTT
jgi:hypothetical protein